jgi:anti-sigma factor RsiW
MVTPLSHTEIEDLLGAYALDAVDGDEARQVADHLVECARCRAEVAEHREVAALLAQGGSPAPAELWDRIAASIDGTGPSEQDKVLVPPPPLFSSPRGDRRRRPRRSRLTLSLAAVAAAVIAALGVQVVGQGTSSTARATSWPGWRRRTGSAVPSREPSPTPTPSSSPCAPPTGSARRRP